jgi:hypothetical protein
MENIDQFLRFGAAIAIGFLIGLQREYAHGGQGRDIIAGERTFALFGLVGDYLIVGINYYSGLLYGGA